ncbi:hypothetical protein F5Y01DRAFT_21719 [Xylaria sp. FL0043]|nr:hypothetical protein F5Y01DRAFT_21719 [Xylaria sp. FL0043]
MSRCTQVVLLPILCNYSLVITARLVIDFYSSPQFGVRCPRGSAHSKCYVPTPSIWRYRRNTLQFDTISAIRLHVRYQPPAQCGRQRASCRPPEPNGSTATTLNIDEELRLWYPTGGASELRKL